MTNGNNTERFVQDANENVIKNEDDKRNTEKGMEKSIKIWSIYVFKERSQLKKIQTNQRYDIREFS